jgi:DNA-binding NarL/FixJ family response regulator
MTHAVGALGAPASLEAWTVGDFLVLTFPIPSPDLGAPLSSAESAVVRAALHGASNQEIATSRGVSIRTVANQLKAACVKLQVSGRAELAAYAATHIAAPGV